MEAMQSFFSQPNSTSAADYAATMESEYGGSTVASVSQKSSWFDDKSLAAITRLAVGVSGFRSEKQAGDYNSQIAAQNAALADQSAADAKQRGEIEARKHSLKVRAMIGDQRASMAAQGVNVNSGSSLDITSDTANWGAYDAETIRANAAREAWGFNVQATNYRNNARLSRMTSNSRASNTLLTSGIEAFKIYKG